MRVLHLCVGHDKSHRFSSIYPLGLSRLFPQMSAVMHRSPNSTGAFSSPHSFYNLIYSTLEREFPGWCMYDHNEIKAGATFHTMKQNIMESYNIKRFRRTTSLPLDFILMNKANGYIWEIHGIKDKATYIEARDMLIDGGKNASSIACSDGYGDYWFQDKDMTLVEAQRRYQDLLDAIYADDNLYQGNGWHLNKPGTPSDFVKLKQRLEVPNRILKAKVDSILL